VLKREKARLKFIFWSWGMVYAKMGLQHGLFYRIKWAWGLDKVVPRGKMLAVDQIMRFSKQRGIIL
jgi:hypothetical protein